MTKVQRKWQVAAIAASAVGMALGFGGYKTMESILDQESGLYAVAETLPAADAAKMEVDDLVLRTRVIETLPDFLLGFSSAAFVVASGMMLAGRNKEKPTSPIQDFSGRLTIVQCYVR